MSRIRALKWELEAALLLSEISYEVQPQQESTALHLFQSRFSSTADNNDDDNNSNSPCCSLCTKAGQKYVLVVCEREGRRVLFCAFAGTHLEGDWEETNVRMFHETNQEEVGASGHAGFLRRALEVPLEGIERIAKDALVSQVIFCGHSLGGAVSHFSRIRWLFALSSSSSTSSSGDHLMFGKDNVLSIACGAPFFGGTDMLDHVKRHGWLDGFITLVNGNDPVPRIMNLAASLVEATFSCAVFSLFNASVAFLTKQQEPLQLLQHSLAEELQKLTDSEPEDTYLTAYLPIGQYLLFGLDGRITLHDDTKVVSDLLGPVQLLKEKTTFVEGFLDKDGIAQHDVKAYRNIVEANGHALNSLCMSKSISSMAHIRNLRQRDSSFPATTLQALNLVPTVHEISCETFTSHERQICRIIKICGHNLDFIGPHSFLLDSYQLDSEWSSGLVLESRISRRSISDLVVEQYLNGESRKGVVEDTPNNTKKAVRSKPSHDIQIRMRSDIVADAGGAASIEPTLHRKNCHSALDMPEDPLSFYGGQFFLDTQQHSWISRELFQDNTLEMKLNEFKQRVEMFRCVKGTEFLDMQPWSRLEDVGQPVSGNHSDSVANRRKHREDLYDWIVPPNGLEVRTKLQTRVSVGVVLTSLAIGGGIIYVGGLGVIGGLLGYGSSLSGGYGTASLIGASGVLSTLFLRSSLRTKYYVMLEDLLKVYTGIISKTMTEMDLEESLLQAEADFKVHLANGTLTRTDIPLYDQYDEHSQHRFKERVAMIHAIHDIKKERLKGRVVAVCGPRDSGKTTLVSQLLKKPKLALSTGLHGGESETRRVTPYSLPGVPAYVLLDTPGLTGPEAKIRDKFDEAALNLASTFVYIREYNGRPSAVDLDTVTKILKSAARCQQPNILICLNRCKTKLTEDVTGEIFDLTAEGEKNDWLDRFHQLRSKSSVQMPSWVNKLFSRCNLVVQFVELTGDHAMEERFRSDVRTAGIWTCSSIGSWISKATAPKETESKENWLCFNLHMNSFNFDEWRTGVRECRDKRKREQEMIEAVISDQ